MLKLLYVYILEKIIIILRNIIKYSKIILTYIGYNYKIKVKFV